MGEQISIKEIRSKETLEQVLTSLRERRECIVNIPGMHPYGFLKTFKKHGINYSRVGFKRWSLSPSTRTTKQMDRSMVVLRLFCFISTIVLVILFNHWVLSLYWAHLESYFISLPLASGIVTGVILIIIPLVAKSIFKEKKFFDIIKKLLGI